MSRLKPLFTVFTVCNSVLKRDGVENVDDVDVEAEEEEESGESECQVPDNIPGGTQTDAEGKRNCNTLNRESKLHEAEAEAENELYCGRDLECNRRIPSPDSDALQLSAFKRLRRTAKGVGESKGA